MKLRLRRSFAFILALVLAAASLSLAASASSAVPGLHGDLVPYRNYTGETTELIAYSELEPFAGKYYYPSTQGYLAYLVAPEDWLYNYDADDILDYWHLDFTPSVSNGEGYAEYYYENDYVHTAAIIDFDGNGVYELLVIHGNIFSISWELYGFDGSEAYVMARDTYEPAGHTEVSFSIWEYSSGETEFVVSQDYMHQGYYENTTAHFVVDDEGAVPYYDGFTGYDGPDAENSSFERHNGVTVDSWDEFAKIMDEVYGDGKMVDPLFTAGLYAFPFFSDDDPEERSTYDHMSLSAIGAHYTSSAIMKLNGLANCYGPLLTIPYVGDPNEMKLTPEMAKAYSDALGEVEAEAKGYFDFISAENELSEEIKPFTVASLFDAGGGIPAMVVLYGMDMGYTWQNLSQMYGFMPSNYSIYVWNGKEAERIVNNAVNADHIFVSDGVLYLYDVRSNGGIEDDGPLFVQKDIIYPLGNGTVDLSSPTEYEFITFFGEEYGGKAPTVSQFKENVEGTKYADYDMSELSDEAWNLEYIYASEAYYVAAKDGKLLADNPRYDYEQLLGFGSYRATDVSYWYTGIWGTAQGVRVALEWYAGAEFPAEYSLENVMETQSISSQAISDIAALRSEFDGGEAHAIYKVKDGVYYLVVEHDWAFSGVVVQEAGDGFKAAKTTEGLISEEELAEVAETLTEVEPPVEPEPEPEPQPEPEPVPEPKPEPKKGDKDDDDDDDRKPVFEMEHQFPWIIVIIAAAGLIVCGGVAALIIVLVSKKKKKAAEPKPAVPAQVAAAPAVSQPQAQVTKFCLHCGAKLAPGSKFCTSCGNKVE